MLFQSGSGPGSPVVGGVCCQALSEVKLENTDKANWRHSSDISQQCSYLFQARFSPKAGLSQETGYKWRILNKCSTKKVLQLWWRLCTV